MRRGLQAVGRWDFDRSLFEFCKVATEEESVQRVQNICIVMVPTALLLLLVLILQENSIGCPASYHCVFLSGVENYGGYQSYAFEISDTDPRTEWRGYLLFVDTLDGRDDARPGLIEGKRYLIDFDNVMETNGPVHRFKGQLQVNVPHLAGLHVRQFGN